jgi:hypothetical protein
MSAGSSGRNLEKALSRAAEIGGVGVGALNLDAQVPHRRVVDLARYGMAARAQALRRHGTERFCSYTFFEQCPHRMACAKCDFYTPKDSSKALLLEAKDNLQRMLAAVPLTDDERAAVDDGQTALDQLLERLADVPTPAGPTPRQLGVRAIGTHLPIVGIHQGPSRRTTT